MAERALFVGWGAPVRGREQKSLEVFGEALAYYAQLQQEGKIESFDTTLLDPHGGDLYGFSLIHGTAAQIGELRASDEFRRLMTRAGMIVEGLGAVGAYTGDAVQAQIATFGEAIAALS